MRIADGSVAKCPLSGCPIGTDGGSSPTIFASGLTYPTWIALDINTIYWTVGGIIPEPGALMKCSIIDCGGQPLTIASGDYPYSVAVDNVNIYWDTFVGSTTGNILRIAK
jgi:hypothetical protein